MSEWSLNNAQLTTPGEHPFFFTGLAGQLEALLSVPDDIDPPCIALLGHPHSLQGGTMNNKVVTTLARIFKELHIPSIRFNFRGVGQSEGVYDKGIGESEDMLCLVRQWKKNIPNARFILAGFSFGSYVAYRAAAQCSSVLLITVAPPVHHCDYTEFSPPPTPWVVVQGEEDEVVPLKCVLDFIKEVPLITSVLRFADTGHFFHGKLVELKIRLQPVIRQFVAAL